MAVRFSPGGARFPESLVEAFIQGRVVLVCGAGVSAPQLPGFRDLVDRIRIGCGLEWEGGEALSFHASRYEECLGTLQRRLIRPERIYEIAARELAVPAAPDFSHHDTLLRLSRDRESRVALVTTNFDTLFERALAQREGPAAAAAISRAGQDLPAPGADSFGGLIHIHGRLADAVVGLTASPLVLTSSEYGEAYMRSGWAARFLFDLARSATLVVIGYSASDAPVRYFLNVLEADRLRFSDLKPVYALDGARPGQEAATEARWAPLAVQVITYPVHVSGAQSDHEALWRDLSQLADLVENTLQVRRGRIHSCLSAPPNEVEGPELDALRWAVQAGAQVDEAIIAAVSASEWWRRLSEAQVLGRDRLARLAASWVSTRWAERDVFSAFLTIGPLLGGVFAQSIDWELIRSRYAEQPWERAWRLLARSIVAGERSDTDASFDIAERLRRGVALDADLRRIIRANTPTVRLGRPFSRERTGEEPAGPPRLSDLAFLSLELHQWADARLLNGLEQDPRRLRIAGLATTTLLDALQDGEEANLIGAGWDITDLQAPAIGPHEQNRLVHGVLPLSSLLATLTPALVADDAISARALFDVWRSSGRRLLTRHWLYALLSGAYSPEEAGRALLQLQPDHFWTMRRDVARVLSEKLAGCPEEVRSALETRILEEGGRHFARYELDSDQDDWRPAALDQELWLRLAMLRRSGPLSEAGRRAFANIRARRSYLPEEPAERDLFTSYTTTSSGPIGDPTPILEADVADRVAVAENLIQTGDFEQAHGWSRFVETAPQAALDSLLASDLEVRRAPLWGELLGRIRYPDQRDQAHMAASRDWLQQSFRHLEPASDSFLDVVGYPLASALEGAQELGADVRNDWWDRLWQAAMRSDRPAHVGEDGLAGTMLSTAAGRLGFVLVAQLGAEIQAGQALSPRLADRVEHVLTSSCGAASPARAALVQDIGLIYPHASALCEQHLHPRLASATPEGQALRAIMMERSRLGPQTSRALRDAMSLGARETRATSPMTLNVASKLLYPLLLKRRRADAPDYGVRRADVAADLAAGPQSLRVAALAYIARWLDDLQGRDASVEWREVVGPVLDGVWPQNKRLSASAYTPHLLSIIAAAANAFPEAAEWARPWLSPFERDWSSLHAITGNLGALRAFPEIVFQVLWAVAGPPFEGHCSDLAEILDAIVEERPQLARDRRMQWLEARTVRRNR